MVQDVLTTDRARLKYIYINGLGDAIKWAPSKATKHRGRSLMPIALEDPSHICWLLGKKHGMMFVESAISAADGKSYAPQKVGSGPGMPLLVRHATADEACHC